MARLPSIVAFAAPSGTGKTTLIERVVRVLVDRGVRVGVLKADAHRVVLDKPGKDSWRFAEAGAAMVAVLSVERLALFERLDGEVTLLSAVERLFPGVDIVLVEGFRRSGVPTVQVHRAGGPSTVGWDPPVNRVAWASDCERSALPGGDGSLPAFSLSDPGEIADWLMERFLSRAPSRAPTIVCPVADPGRLEGAVAAATRLAREVGGRAMVVASPDIPVRRVAAGEGPDCDVVTDIRPGMGLLGALYTGLAAARTPEILFVGPRYWDSAASRFAGILRPGLAGSDVVYTVADGFPEPALALYGHRCLSAIQAALLSGEFKLTGWWGQVRTLAG